MLCEKQNHSIPPVWDENSRVLILGSFPSVRSRAVGFYYGHPQNRFWRVLAAVLGQPVPQTTEEKCAMLLANRIALWDVIASCEIVGSSDSSIRNAVPNDVENLLKQTHITKIFTNGGTATRLYKRHLQKSLQIEAIDLPSTSPANAAKSQTELIEAWRVVAEACR